MTQHLSIYDALYLIDRLGFYVKDAGQLEGALARPRTTVFGEDAYPTLSLKGASLMHSSIKNHPMIDGNKRTSWTLMVAYLRINNFSHDMTTDEGFDLTLGIAENRYELNRAAEIIERHLVKLGD
jgi:death-on-curing protein